jgi:hypothetical protein
VGDCELRHAELGNLAHFLRRSAAGLVDAATGEHEQHGSTEVRRNTGVVAELRRGADIGVVAADDDHGIALGLYLLEPLDYYGEGGIRVIVDGVVGDADALLVL